MVAISNRGSKRWIYYIRKIKTEIQSPKSKESSSNRREQSLLKQQKIVVYFDGLCQPYNPGGIACYAFIIKRYDNGGVGRQQHQQQQQQIIHSEYGLAAEPFRNEASNNVAEYTAIIKALEWLLLNYDNNEFVNNKTIIIKGDSQLAIYQITGKYKVKAARIIPLHQKVISLISKFKDIHVEWIPSEKNEEADRLSNKAYQEVLENNPALHQKISQYMATEKQLKLLRSLGIEPEKYISKIEANKLISKIKSNY